MPHSSGAGQDGERLAFQVEQTAGIDGQDMNLYTIVPDSIQAGKT